jgi:tetratricopeptide (TPR) repeat protein
LASKKGKNTKTKKNEVKHRDDKQKSMLEKYIFIILTCILIFFPAFFRGLFFERELRVVHIATFILVLIWLVLNYKGKAFPIIRYRYEYFLFAAVAMYFITIPFAASRRLALLEALKYVNYLAVYILVRDHVIRDKRLVKVFLNTMLASVSAMCIIGLMNYFGFIKTSGALIGGRISSTLQYPNTFAAVIGATVFVNLYLAQETENRLVKAAYTALLNIMFITFVLTYSRTMYIMLPVLLIAFLAVSPSRLRMDLIVVLSVTMIPALSATALLIRYSGSGNAASIIILLVSVLLSVALSYIVQRTNKAFALTGFIKYILVGVLMIVIVAGIILSTATQPLELAHHDTDDSTISSRKTVYSVEGEGNYLLRMDIDARQTEEKSWIGRVVINSVNKANKTSTIKNHYIKEEIDGPVEIPFSTYADTYYITIGFYNYYNGTSFTVKEAEIINQSTGESLGELKLSYKYLPQNLVSRIESINIKARSFQGRIAFFRDAFEIIKDNFLIGLGGGAWEAAYMRYRSYEYWTTQTHSYPIQVWMEIGTLGLVLVIGFIVFYAIKIMKAYMAANTENAKLQLTATVAFAAGVLAHSLVDFDLGLGAVSIMLWTSFALAPAHFAEYEKTTVRTGVYVKPLFISVLIVLLGVTTFMGAAIRFNRQTAEAFDNKDYKAAEKAAKTAVKLDPLNSTYRVNLANVINRDEGIDKKDKYWLISTQLEQALKNDSFNTEFYVRMALHQYSYARFDDAVRLLDKAIMLNPSIPESYTGKMNLLYSLAEYYYEQEDEAGAIETLNRLKNVKEVIKSNNKQLLIPVKVNPELLSYYYKANFILDNMEDNENIFGIADSVVMYEDFSFDSDSNLLPDLWEIPYQDDKTVKGGIKKEEGAEVFSLTADSPSFYIQRMNMGLKPSSRYLLVIEGHSRLPEGKLRVIIGSGSGKKEQYKDGYFAFNEETKVYETTFETTDDIEEGSQYIRLYFNDIQDEVILRKVIIIRIG